MAKGDIVRQISKGAKSKTAKEIMNNRNLIKKFIKMIYFLAKKKWAVKNNFEETIEYFANLGVDDLFQHINNAPKNSTYISTFIAEQFLKAVGDFLSNQIITDLIAAGDFTILADESTDEADHSQMSIFVCFVDAFGNKPVEIFLGIVKLTTSKKAVDLHEIIIKHLESKNLDSLCIRFSGLDGTNTMNGEQKGLQHLIRHTAPHSQYLNYRNHRLALCLVHLIPCYQELLELHGVLFSLWKTLKYSSIKQAIFEQAQEASNLKFLNVLKACTTRWLLHSESCIRIISRFHPLINAVDVIFFE